MPDGLLVRPLPGGPLDVLGDVHGEIDSLLRLLDLLGYDRAGRHPQGRRLVFVGDLADRGPDSPAVLDLVQDMVEQGVAECVLGNHELNLMLGKKRPGNAWFYGLDEVIAPATWPVVSRHAGEPDRQRYLDFFRRLPLALERDDLVVVHACWHHASVDQMRGERDALLAYQAHRNRIDHELRRRGVEDVCERSLAHQNDNPVKVLTSGPEMRTSQYFASGKWRTEARQRWWDDYRHERFCVFGHYWRRPLGDSPEAHLFHGVDDHHPLGPGHCTCIDYSVGKRWLERFDNPGGPFTTALAALRWPERLLAFDDGRVSPLGARWAAPAH